MRTTFARILTLAMCAGALLFILFVPVPYAIDFQLLGGALMLQTFPAFVLGLWTRWFNPRALLAGWAAGIATSCTMAYASGFAPNFTARAFGGEVTGFIALYALLGKFDRRGDADGYSGKDRRPGRRRSHQPG